MATEGISTFGYPGGKMTIAPWIIDHFPDHTCYVEPFGGSAAVLLRKPQSDLEIYNDIDSEVVDIFRALRNHGDELQHRLRNVPYSRELFEVWKKDYVEGNDPDDLVERVTRNFALRYMAYGSKLTQPSFRSAHTVRGPTDSPAIRLKNSVENLHRTRDRFREVIIENLSYSEMLEKYDSDETLFYMDPPYVGTGYYRYGGGGTFDHSTFCEEIKDIDGELVVSLGELPDALPNDEYHIVSRSRDWKLSDDSSGSERLVMNFDPQSTPSFSPKNQQLTAFGDGGNDV